MAKTGTTAAAPLTRARFAADEAEPVLVVEGEVEVALATLVVALLVSVELLESVPFRRIALR